MSSGTKNDLAAKHEPFRVTVRWGHLDRMPKCEHGRVICKECGL